MSSVSVRKAVTVPLSQAEPLSFEFLVHRYLVLQQLKWRLSRVSVNRKKFFRAIPPMLFSDSVAAEAWFSERFDGCKPDTRRQAVATVRRFLVWCAFRTPVDPDLLDYFTTSRSIRRRTVEIYSQIEVDLLLEWPHRAAIRQYRSNSWTRVEHAAFMLLVMHCGLRKSEASNLRWSEVDFKKGFLYLDVDGGRELKSSNAQRAVPMSDELNLMLRIIRDSTWRDRVFKGPFAECQTIRISEEAGVHWCCQKGRRTFISALYAADVSARSVCIAVGHQSEATTARHYWGRKRVVIPGLEVDRFTDLHKA